jgi:spermidine synthase
VLYAEKGRTLAGAYGIESTGALTGGLLATLCLRWGIQNFSFAIASGLITAITVLLLSLRGKGLHHRIIAAGLATLMAILLWYAMPLDRRMTAWNHPGLLDTRDSPYGRITVTTHSGQVAIFIDDVLASETEGTEAELFAHISALQHPKPQRILVLGGGLDGTVRELLRHRPAQIDLIELDSILVATARSLLPEAIRSSLSDPAVRLTIADPRHFLKESGSAYDLILICTPEPSSGQANRFYTREFFRECAARLTPAGVIGLRLPTAENFWTSQLIRRTASIHLALTSVFPEVLVLPGTTTIITASHIPLPRSADILIERLRMRALQTRLVSPPYIRYLFTNDRRFDLEKRLKKTIIPMNTDIRPVCYPSAVMIWLSRFFPKLAMIDLPGFGIEINGLGKIWWLIGFGIPILFLAIRLRLAWRRTLLVIVAGFLGIIFEAVLMLSYQARVGVLYQDIGLFLMMFMAGLAIGAWILNEAIRWTGVRHKRTRWWGAGLLAGFGTLGIASVVYVTGEYPGSLIPTASLLAAAGFLVAGILAYAGLYGIRDQKQVIAPLYAADLIGGGLGSLLGSLILIPFLGLDGTIKGMLVLTAFSLFLI